MISQQNIWGRLWQPSAGQIALIALAVATAIAGLCVVIFETKGSAGLGKASLVTGIIAVFGGFFLMPIWLVFGVPGIVAAVISKRQSYTGKSATIGIILSLIATVLGVGFPVIFSMLS